MQHRVSFGNCLLHEILPFRQGVLLVIPDSGYSSFFGNHKPGNP